MSSETSSSLSSSHASSSAASSAAARPAPADVHDAVATALAALLHDRDVSEIACVEGGLLELVRRGRRERPRVVFEGALFAVLREHGAGAGPVRLSLADGHTLTAGPLVDGRLAFAIHKAPPTDASIAHLVEEGVLPAGIGEELLSVLLEGRGVVVLGPARATRTRVVVALARAALSSLRIVALTSPAPAGALPAPVAADVVTRARLAVALGADLLVAHDLHLDECTALAHARLAVPLACSVASSSAPALEHALDGARLEALAGAVAVVGFTPDGRPRLLELQGGASSASSSASPSPSPYASSASSASSSSPAASPGAASAASVVAGLVARPASSTASPSPPSLASTSSNSSAATITVGSTNEDGVVLGDAPPSDWGTSGDVDDPGWELGALAGTSSSLPPAASVHGSFDAALQAVAKRPSFTPRPPPLHPQARALRGTGGLTLEPPGAVAGADADADADAGVDVDAAAGAGDDETGGPR